LSDAQRECRTCDLMLVAGSSLEVLPVAGMPMNVVDRGAHLVIINNSPTYIDVRADAIIREDVADVLPAIAEKVLHADSN
jgi:NAD-dependent deacetylase